jgi:hypothetical protein
MAAGGLVLGSPLLFTRRPPIIAADFALTVTFIGDRARVAGDATQRGKAVQDLTERRNEEAREVRDLLAAKLKMHPIWLGGLDTQAARHIYLFIQALEGRKPFGRVRRQRAPNLTLD